MDFKELSKGIGHEDPLALLVFDPGHTTGWAFFEEMELKFCGEVNTEDIETAVRTLSDLFELYVPYRVVIEDYRVYRWRAKHHIGSQMMTTRVIGCIETLCIQQGIYEITKQPAHIAKGFCTDKKLKDWGFYQKAQKHANDAIRHGCYYLLFGPIKHKDRQGSIVG